MLGGITRDLLDNTCAIDATFPSDQDYEQEQQKQYWQTNAITTRQQLIDKIQSRDCKHYHLQMAIDVLSQQEPTTPETSKADNQTLLRAFLEKTTSHNVMPPALRNNKTNTAKLEKIANNNDLTNTLDPEARISLGRQLIHLNPSPLAVASKTLRDALVPQPHGSKTVDHRQPSPSYQDQISATLNCTFFNLGSWLTPQPSPTTIESVPSELLQKIADLATDSNAYSAAKRLEESRAKGPNTSSMQRN